MNQIIWNKNTLKKIQGFSDEIKRELGYLLYKLQRGETLTMPYSKPMPSVGKGCYELRINGEDGAYRVFYVLKTFDGVLVFHAFKKTTQKTSQRDIDLGKKILREMT